MNHSELLNGLELQGACRFDDLAGKSNLRVVSLNIKCSSLFVSNNSKRWTVEKLGFCGFSMEKLDNGIKYFAIL